MIYWPPIFRMYRFVNPYGGYVLCRWRVDDLDDPGAPSRHMLLKCCWLNSPTVGKWSMNVGYSSINPLDFLAFYSQPNLIILPRHHCNTPRILQARFDRTKRPKRLAKAQGGPLKFLTNPLRYSMVPAGHWCAKIRCAGHTSRGRQGVGLTSSCGKCNGESMGNIWKFDDYTIGFRDVEIVSLLDKPILGENDGFFSQIDGGMGRISNLFMRRLGSMRQFYSLLVFGDPLVSKNGRSKSRVGGGAVASHDAGWMIQAVCRHMLHKWPQKGSNLFFI